MKIGTTEKLKFKRLQRALNLPHWQAVGILESLWHVAIHNTPAGDIGKLPNADITLLIEYDGDPDEFISVLISSGWLDESEEHRLVIHDWHEHVPSYLKGAFAKHGKQFASLPADGAMQPAKQGAKHPASDVPPYQSYPIQTKPNHKPREARTDFQLEEIFNYWRGVFKLSNAKFDVDRQKAIWDALSLGFKPEDLKMAIRGCAVSPWHVERKVYSLQTILKNADAIEKFIGYVNEPPKPADGNGLKRPRRGDDAAWMALCERFGVKTYGKTEDQLWSKIQEKAQ